jgi:hypothetical protein
MKDRSDFLTSVTVAVLTFLVTLPALFSPWQGSNHFYKIFFVLGPLGMVFLAWIGRRRDGSAGPEGDR